MCSAAALAIGSTTNEHYPYEQEALP